MPRLDDRVTLGHGIDGHPVAFFQGNPSLDAAEPRVIGFCHVISSFMVDVVYYGIWTTANLQAILLKRMGAPDFYDH
jgi:hypothetical protein